MKTAKHFTLIELLIVVSIIAILASMLLPAMSKARSKAHESVCLGNLKQVYMMFNFYGDEENNFLPPSSVLYTIHPSGKQRSFHDYLLPYVNADLAALMNVPGTEHYIAMQSAWSGHGGTDIFKCPSGSSAYMSGTYGIGEGAYYQQCGQGMNAYFQFDYNGIMEGHRLMDQPEKQIVIADGTSIGVLNVNLWPTQYGVHPRHRSGNAANYLFVSGAAAINSDHHLGGWAKWWDLNGPWRAE